MATIKRIERKKGVTYKITVLLGTDSEGKQIRQTTTYVPESTSPAKQEKEVQKHAMEFEEKVRNGMVLTGEKLTLEQYCLNWLEESKSRLTPGSYSYYEAFIKSRLIPALGYLKLENIKPKHIKDFIYTLKSVNGKELKASSVKKNLTIVKSIFKTAWEDEIISTNPTERVKPPRQEGNADKVHCFNAEQAKIFLGLLDCGLEYHYSERTRTTADGTPYRVSSYSSTHEIPTQYKIFFSIALLGGLRKGEVLGLTWDDVDFSESTININKSVCYSNKTVFVKEPKTKTSIRCIRLPGSLMNMLKKYRKEWLSYKLKLGTAWQGEGDYLFIQADGKIMHPSTPYHRFQEILTNYNSTVKDEKKKLPMITLHDLRHTSASLLLSNNVDLMTVSKRLGHSKKSTTLDIYAHIIEDIDKSASDKMEDIFFRKEA